MQLPLSVNTVRTTAHEVELGEDMVIRCKEHPTLCLIWNDLGLHSNVKSEDMKKMK
jgi:hypothetical protein